MASTSVTGFIQPNVPTNAVILLADADITLSASDSGKIFLLSAVAADGTTTITLPAAPAGGATGLQQGLTYKFVMNAAVGPTNARILKISGGGTTMKGLLLTGGATVAAAIIKTADGGSASASFIGGAAGTGGGLGDMIEVTYNGTKWSIFGVGQGLAPFAIP